MSAFLRVFATVVFIVWCAALALVGTVAWLGARDGGAEAGGPVLAALAVLCGVLLAVSLLLRWLL